MTNSLSDYQTDNLMLLVGTNPLPNYVAARLLANSDTRFHLVVTPEIQKAKIHQRLITLILGQEPSDETFCIPVESADPGNIYAKVKERVANTEGTWGLHYTGGKKSMATQAYRAMEDTLAAKKEQGIYSYLDADTLCLVIDPRETKRNQFFPSKLTEPVSLWQLLYLHGKPDATLTKVKWKPDSDEYFRKLPLGEKPHRVPFQPDLCEVLKNACLSDNTQEIIQKWYLRELRLQPHRFLLEIYETPEQAREIARNAVMLTEKYDPANEHSKNWVKKCGNPDFVYSRWRSVAFPDYIQEQTNITTIQELAGKTEQKIGHVAEWLQGAWLEHYVLQQILAIKDQCEINDYALGLESNLFEATNYKQDVFESDVIVMQGYRLFYISVTMDATKPLSKSKLFEAYIRAQHLGGEQAKAALVTFYLDSQKLERELLDERHAQVKVFSPKHFANTENFRIELKKWFEHPRKEITS